MYHDLLHFTFVEPLERDLLQRNLKLAEENNQMLHSLRRAQRWSMVWGILKWLLIFGVSGAAYYFYLQPYVEQLLALYRQMQEGGAQFNDYQQQISQFFANWMHASTTPQ